MKLATFRHHGPDAIGIVHDNESRLFKLAEATALDAGPNPAFASMLALIDSDEDGLAEAARLFAAHGGRDDLSVPLAAVQLLAPLPEPRQMRDGMGFAGHILQAARGMKALKVLLDGDEAGFRATMAEPLGPLAPVYRQAPVFYLTNRFSVSGPDATVRWPRYSTVMDYEAEIAIVTRRSAANIPALQARNHIFGYVIYNDFSARDRQLLDIAGRLGPAKGKSFDGGNALGPWIVTSDELGDPYNLAVDVRVNGEVRARSTTAGMLFSFEQMLEYISADETVQAGEIIGSGTVAGGSGLELGRFLADGDRIDIAVERLGVLSSRVARQGA